MAKVQITASIDVGDLAIQLTEGLTQDAILNLIKSLDAHQQDWSFSKRIIAWASKLQKELAADLETIRKDEERP